MNFIISIILRLNRYQKSTTYIFFSVISLLVISCSTQINNKQTKSQLDTPLVLTTFTVLADIASNIAGDRLQIESITKLGAEIHGYKPTPSDLVRASSADLIIENGLGLELWAKKFTTSIKDTPVVVLTKGMKPIMIQGDEYNGRPNPHAWMSPKRAMKYVDNIVSAFILLDPEGKELFIENANIYKSQLLKLDLDLRAALEPIPLKKRVLVSCEGAFSYLAEDYGFKEAYLWPVNSESQVTPRRMEALIETINNTGVPVIFCESTVSEKAQLQIAKITGTTFGGKFFVDSLSELDGPAASFLKLQRHNVRLILKGFSLQNSIKSN